VIAVTDGTRLAAHDESSNTDEEARRMFPKGKKDSRAEVLKDIDLFSGSDTKTLAKITSITTEVECEPGRELCRQGTAGDQCFIIVEGWASLIIDGEEVGGVGPGSIVGELALLDPGPRTATVTAQTPMRLLVFSRSEFTTMLFSAPDVVRRMLKVEARRVRQADQEPATSS
jgi:CRP-like cAMP-binding protein